MAPTTCILLLLILQCANNASCSESESESEEDLVTMWEEQADGCFQNLGLPDVDVAGCELVAGLAATVQQQGQAIQALQQQGGADPAVSVQLIDNSFGQRNVAYLTINGLGGPVCISGGIAQFGIAVCEALGLTQTASPSLVSVSTELVIQPNVNVVWEFDSSLAGCNLTTGELQEWENCFKPAESAACTSATTLVGVTCDEAFTFKPT